jgi:tRNA pseudouridine38-40 synthase
VLEDALRDLDEREVAVVGAGRTDAGVHALGQAASFALTRPMAADAIVRALNARLPASVRVLAACEAPDSFHARFAAKKKTYRYRIWNADVLSPFERSLSWHLPGPLDRDAMTRAAALLEGRHDFAAFQAAGSHARSTEREIFSSRVSGRAEAVEYEVTGDGFLRHMVRAIMGTLVEVGRGRHAASWVSDVLAQRDRGLAGPTAPAQGLTLVSVEYDDTVTRLAGRR